MRRLVGGEAFKEMPARRFPPPWTFDEANHACFIVRDANKFAVAYVYFCRRRDDALRRI
jgi:hypothetical protein